MQIFLKDLEDVKLLLACVGGGSARLKFWRRSRDPKKGVGTRRLNFAAYVAYPGYQRFFSRAAGIFGVGRRPTHLRP